MTNDFNNPKLIPALSAKVCAMNAATIQFPNEQGLKDDLEYFRAQLRQAELEAAR